MIWIYCFSAKVIVQALLYKVAADTLENELRKLKGYEFKIKNNSHISTYLNQRGGRDPIKHPH